ncbi:MAG: cell division protein FtsL [Gammaproteobacteria bacterium]
MRLTESGHMREAEEQGRAQHPPQHSRMAFALICWLLLVVTALAVVTVRHQNRQAFVALLRIENAHSELQFENGRLLLERATWARRHNIVGIAHKRLGMAEPAPGEIITLTLERDHAQ